MDSSMASPPPAPIRGKLSQVKYLLDDANKRLQAEASKCEIFTTRTSASGSNHQNGDHNVPTDLITTISDISTLKSVLSCSVFNHIVNVTDSLDKLSSHVNLHPSTGPADFDFNSNGELILAPPIEPTSLNNLINSQFDEYSDQSHNSPQISSPHIHQSNKFIGENQVSSRNEHGGAFYGQSDVDGCSNGLALAHQHQQDQMAGFDNQQYFVPRTCIQEISQNQYVPSPSIISSMRTYDTEKLVSNGNKKAPYLNGNKQVRRQSTKMELENDENDGQSLYKSNGHFTLDQVNSNIDVSSQSINHANAKLKESSRSGYNNEFYETTHEMNSMENMAIAHQAPTQTAGENQNNSYLKNVQNQNSTLNGKTSLQHTGVQYNRGSCSPSTSVGSTVRLADDGDSGASSYQSHTAKGGTPYSPYPYKSADPINEPVTQGQKEDRLASMEQELDNLLPEMERIRVTLEKDEKHGLGITIAGYICDKDDLSGIFIKRVQPNSPADKSGKVRTLDQIFAVNGQELLGFTNEQAVNVLKNAGKVVTLELMRHLAETKYRNLENALAHAVLTLDTNTRLTNNLISVGQSSPNNVHINAAQNSSNVITSPTKSSIPVSKRDANQSVSTNFTPPTAPSKPVQVSNNQSNDNDSKEIIGSVYKNGTSSSDKAIATKVSASKHSTKRTNESITSDQSQNSNIPVAAQRGGTNKVIETKQGARNTIEIRPPIYQPTNATYVNKISESELYEAAKNSATARLQNETSDEFGRLVKSEEPEWEKDAQIIELYKDPSQSLGFTVKDYANPKDPKQSIIMITSLTPGGIAERDGRLSFGDLLIFVDDTNLEGASLEETVRALKRTNGQVRLGVLKLKRN